MKSLMWVLLTILAINTLTLYLESLVEETRPTSTGMSARTSTCLQHETTYEVFKIGNEYVAKTVGDTLNVDGRLQRITRVDNCVAQYEPLE